jgi:hypothetical protein
VASSVELLLLASLTGGNAPDICATDATSYSSGNVTTATAVTKAWPLLPGTPQAGTAYELKTEFSGTWEAVAMALNVQVNSTWTQLNPSVGAPSWGTSTVIAGWLELAVRVQTATTARFALKGAIGETASSYTPGSGSIALAPLSQALTIAAASTIALGVYFGSSAAGQGIATYGSTWRVIGAGI